LQKALNYGILKTEGYSMAEITLREYIREIGLLIDNEQLDEAIAHCLHILQVYPKHLEAYRQLGKAYLEANRFTDAADVFQRVLSAVPGDFVSHVGMAVIREDEGNLDSAIWHMERAYESNPANNAIHEELRRLIAERDGVAPQKIRLTRGALAHMYARGEMYQQAIVELQTSLEEEPDRPDLQVLLAEMFWRTGQRVEAAEVCSEVLEELPFCQEANRIMAAMLQTSDQAEEGTVYHRRLAALDPYAAFIESAVIDPDTVSDEAVKMMRGEWHPGKPIPSGEGRMPDWAAEIGLEVGAERAEEAEPEAEPAPEPAWLEEIGISSRESEQPEEFEGAAGGEAAVELPAWLEEIEPLEEAQTVVEETPEPSAPPFAEQEEGQPEAEIPAWMQDAGWKPSEGEVEEGPVTFTDEELDALEAGVLPEEDQEPEEEEELAPAEIPDWLMEIAPSEVEEAEEELLAVEEDEVIAEVLGAEEEVEEKPPDWLSGIVPEEGAVPEEGEGVPAWAEAQPEEGEPESGAPDWMQGISEAAEEPAEASSDWLRGISAEQAPEEPAQGSRAEEAPDWLSGIAAEAAEEEAEEAVPEGTAEEGASWLGELEEEGVAEEAELEQPAPAEERELEPEADLGWLNALAPDAEPEEEAEEELYRAEAAPEAHIDWLSGIAPEGEGEAEETAQAEEAAAPEAAEPPTQPEGGLIPSWLEEEEPGESSTIVGWLGTQSLAEQDEEGAEITEEAEAEAPPFYSPQPDERHVPEWLLDAQEGEGPSGAIPEPHLEGAPEPEEAMQLEGMGEGPEPEAREHEEQLMDELEAAEQAPELAREAETPDWLKDYAEEISEPSGAGEEQGEAEGWEAAAGPAATEEVETPETLEPELEGYTAEVEEGAEISAEEAEDWLARLPSAGESEEELALEGEAEELDEELYETPDWLQEITQEPGVPIGQEAEDIIGLEDEYETQPGEFEWADSAEREEPDWLSESGGVEEGAEALEEVEIPDWLLEPADEFASDEVEQEAFQPDLRATPEAIEAEMQPEEEPELTAPEERAPAEEEPLVAESEAATQEAPEEEGEAIPEAEAWIPLEPEAEPEMAQPARMEGPPVAEERAEVGKRKEPFDPDEVLQSAKEALETGDFELAAGQYGELTRKKEALHVTVEDLRVTLEREPRQPQLWQVLGDAYMQMDRIAEAIEAYQRGTEVI
jgi:tetratricopeptide (TPR) repeat protein